MTESNGKRQAIRRATSAGTLVECESCRRVEVVRLPVSKAVESLGWWRADHDLIVCDGCYRVATDDLGWIPGETERFFDAVRGSES